MTKAETAKRNADIRRRMKVLAHKELCHQIAQYKVDESYTQNLTSEELAYFNSEHKNYMQRIIKAI